MLKLYTIGQYCRVTGEGPCKTRKRIESGELKAWRWGRHILVIGPDSATGMEAAA